MVESLLAKQKNAGKIILPRFEDFPRSYREEPNIIPHRVFRRIVRGQMACEKFPDNAR